MIADKKGNPVEIKIKGKELLGGNHPDARSAFKQMDNYLDLIKKIELDKSKQKDTIWLITNAKRTNPLEITFEPRTHNVDILSNAINDSIGGIRSIVDRCERPPSFSDNAMGKAKEFFTCLKYLSGIEIITQGKDNHLILSSNDGIKGAKNTKIILESNSYTEIGSVEGFVISVKKDQEEKFIFEVKNRVDGEILKCVADKNVFKEMSKIKLGKIWEGLRVCIHGELKYNYREILESVKIEDFSIYDSDYKLSHEDVLDKNYTDGMGVMEYLNSIRDD